MRQIVALAAGLTLMAASAATAGIPWYSNAPKPAVPDPNGSGFMLQDGPFSDAFSSGGNYFYSFALGQRFSIGSTQTFGSVRLWGASEYIESGIPPWQQPRLSHRARGVQRHRHRDALVGVAIAQRGRLQRRGRQQVQRPVGEVERLAARPGQVLQCGGRLHQRLHVRDVD